MVIVMIQSACCDTLVSDWVERRKKCFRQHDWKVSLGKKGSRCSDVKVKYKNWDTFAHLRASYIQCSPSKRTFTAELLTARLLHITHDTGWEIICNFFRFKGQNDISAKEEQCFFSILSRHVFHLYAWYCSNIYLVSLQRRKHFESLRIAWFPTRGFLYCHSIIRGKPAPLFFFPENINEYPFLQLCSRQKLEILASPNSTK